MDQKESIAQQIDSDFIVLGDGNSMSLLQFMLMPHYKRSLVGNILNKDIPDDVLNCFVQPFFMRAVLYIRTFRL